MQKMDNNDFVNKVFSLVNNEYTFLEKYNGSNNKILVRHNKCNKEYLVTPNKFLNKGTRCPYCSGNKHLSNEEFLEKINSKDNYFLTDYKILDTYSNNKTKLRIKHLKCNKIFKLSPDSLLNKGTRCPYCSGNKHLSNEEFLEKAKELKHFNDYEFLEDYINSDVPIKIKHLKCGNIYSVAPYNFLANKQCPFCKDFKNSYFSKEIESYLIENNIKYTKEIFIGCRFKRKLYYDFFLNDYDLLLELDGTLHFKKNKTYFNENIRTRDLIKNNYVLENNLNLLRMDLPINNHIKHIEEKKKDLNEILNNNNINIINERNYLYITKHKNFNLKTYYLERDN